MRIPGHRSLFKKSVSHRELVDANEAIREMVVLLRSEATRYNITVRVELPEDLPQIMEDCVQLQQVLMNLTVNSIDAMKEVDGTRELTIYSQRTTKDEVLVSVNDTGVGLPPQQAGQIFDAFFTTKPHGTGMGLRISRSIVESHGGRLWAADNSPRGATFHLALPTKIEAKEWAPTVSSKLRRGGTVRRGTGCSYMAPVNLIGSYNYALVAFSLGLKYESQNPIQYRRVPEAEGCSPILDK